MKKNTQFFLAVWTLTAQTLRNQWHSLLLNQVIYGLTFFASILIAIFGLILLATDGTSWAGFIAGLTLILISVVISILIVISALHRGLQIAMNVKRTYTKKVIELLGVLWISLLMFCVVGLGMLILVLPGIYFTAVLSGTLPIYISGGGKGYAAMQYSMKLLRPYILGVIAIHACMLLVSGLLYVLLSENTYTAIQWLVYTPLYIVLLSNMTRVAIERKNLS
jgi:hypothetical protein